VASERPAYGAKRLIVSGQERHLAKTDLGDKQVCPSCGAKFYDLRRRPAVCPKCTTSFDPAEEGVRAKRGRARVAAHDPAYDDDEEVDAKKKAKAGDDDEDEDEEAEETAEVDAEAEPDPIVTDDEEEDATAKSSEDELPEGFSEEEADLGESAADDDTVPLIDDEEEFPEDELGEIAGENEDDDGGR
jgi:uncharacterized protein (TIGR02300 family)